MPRAKKHVEAIFRTKPREGTRRGCLRLDLNEGVPGLPDSFVRQTLHEVNGGFLSTYPEYNSITTKIAAHNGLRRENILLANGSDSAIKLIFDAYVSPGQRVLLTDPTFAMYPIYCRIANARPVMIPYKPDLSFPTGEFMERLVPGTRLAVAVNPNNPTGTAIPGRTLAEIIRKAEKSDVLLIVDEAYFYFHPKTVISSVLKCENLVVLRTFSKLCGIAAGRLGYAAACPAVVENLRRVRPTFDVNAFGALFAERLLDRPAVMRGLIRGAAAGKKYLVGMLRHEGIEHIPGAANFVVIKCGSRVNEIISRLERQNILVGAGFKHSALRDCVRVTIGSKVIMERFWRAFVGIWRD